MALSIVGLEVLRSAASLRSFSAAGHALGYSQPAVSRRIAELERTVGAQLFERAPRGVRLTEAGELLLAHSAAALDELAAARAAIDRLGERLSGTLTVGAIPTAGMGLVPRAIARLAATHPEVRVELHEGSTPALVDRIVAGSLDLAVVALRPAGRPQDFGPICPEVLFADPLRVALATTHRLAARERVPVAELRDEPWIIGRPRTDGEPIFATWPSLPEPRIAFAAHEWPARLGLVAAGLGVALVPGLVALSLPSGVVAIDVDDPQHDRDPSAALVTAADAPPSAGAMGAALRAEAVRFAMGRPAGERPPALGGRSAAAPSAPGRRSRATPGEDLTKVKLTAGDSSVEADLRRRRAEHLASRA